NQLIRLFSILSILILFASCSVVTEFLNNLEKGKSTQTESSADSIDDFYKVIGQINGTDIKNLRKQINEGQITKLDLSKAVIVAGGDAYYQDSDGNQYFSSDGVIGDFMFYECKKLSAVILPSSVTSIGKRAFSKTGLTSIDIPNNITYLGYDSFVYNSSLESVIVGNKVTSCVRELSTVVQS
nr:leucine-rich repeat domain-containing protein [Treponema sp.]